MACCGRGEPQESRSRATLPRSLCGQTRPTLDSKYLAAQSHSSPPAACLPANQHASHPTPQIQMSYASSALPAFSLRSTLITCMCCLVDMPHVACVRCFFSIISEGGKRRNTPSPAGTDTTLTYRPTIQASQIGAKPTQPAAAILPLPARPPKSTSKCSRIPRNARWRWRIDLPRPSIPSIAPPTRSKVPRLHTYPRPGLITHPLPSVRIFPQRPPSLAASCPKRHGPHHRGGPSA